MPFDPNAYLAKKTEAQFDPDAYLASKLKAPEPGLIEKGLENIMRFGDMPPKGAVSNVVPYAPGKAPLSARVEQAQRVLAPSTGQLMQALESGAGFLPTTGALKGVKDLYGYLRKGEAAGTGIAKTGAKAGTVGEELIESEIKPSIEVSSKSILEKEAPSLKDLEKKATELETSGAVKERPVYGAVKAAEKELKNIGVKLEGLQDAMLKDEAKEATFRALKQLPQTSGPVKSLKTIENAQRNAIVKNIENIAEKRAGRPLAEKEAIGKELSKEATDLFNKTNQELSPVFEEFKNIPLDNRNVAFVMRNKIAEQVPELGEYLAVSPKKGYLQLKPYDMTMGLTPQEHSLINKSLASLNKPKLSFKEVQRVREAMRNQMDPLNPSAYRGAEGVRKAMLGGLEELVAQHNPSAKVRDTFQKYAINADRLEKIEDLLGGRIDPKAPTHLKARSDKIIDTVFSSPEAIEQAAEYFGPEKVKKLSGDYLNQMIKTATDEKGNFSINRFASIWKQKKPLLAKVLDTKDVRQLDASIVFMKGVTDLAPFNPSGTAPASKIYESVMNPMQIPGKIAGAIPKYLEQRGLLKELEKLQAGQQQQTDIMAAPFRMAGGLLDKVGGPGPIPQTIRGGLLMKKRQESSK